MVGVGFSVGFAVGLGVGLLVGDAVTASTPPLGDGVALTLAVDGHTLPHSNKAAKTNVNHPATGFQRLRPPRAVPSGGRLITGNCRASSDEQQNGQGDPPPSLLHYRGDQRPNGETNEAEYHQLPPSRRRLRSLGVVAFGSSPGDCGLGASGGGEVSGTEDCSPGGSSCSPGATGLTRTRAFARIMRYRALHVLRRPQRDALSALPTECEYYGHA